VFVQLCRADGKTTLDTLHRTAVGLIGRALQKLGIIPAGAMDSDVQRVWHGPLRGDRDRAATPGPPL
jgi:hypothetical protein